MQCSMIADAAVQFDADGQHRPEYIAPLLARLNDG